MPMYSHSTLAELKCFPLHSKLDEIFKFPGNEPPLTLNLES